MRRTLRAIGRLNAECLIWGGIAVLGGAILLTFAFPDGPAPEPAPSRTITLDRDAFRCTAGHAEPSGRKGRTIAVCDQWTRQEWKP